MSSHREAPSISKDPVADNTDLYAFRDPTDPTKVTILANYIPLEEPAGGPNFFNFGDDVLYEILIDNNGDGVEDVVYQFRFKTKVANGATFLYNTLPISFNGTVYENLNINQSYTVTRVKGRRRKGSAKVLATGLRTPPVNVGPLSTPDYANLVPPSIHDIGSGRTVFAGQRRDGFYVDLGSIFDLGNLRPFAAFHILKPPPEDLPKDGVSGFNVHTIALRVPITDLTAGGVTPKGFDDPKAVLGIWAAASRQKATIRNGASDSDSDSDDSGDRTRGDEGDDDSDDSDDREVQAGPWTQVSRLGNPLINEVIIPLGKKDGWNATEPKDDKQFKAYYDDPELSRLIPFLYSPSGIQVPPPPRTDVVTILLTGIPAGAIPGFANFTGKVLADYLRLNVAIPVAEAPDPLGLLGGDIQGFPNGRRVMDDVVDIELRALAGATPFTPGFNVFPNNALADGISPVDPLVIPFLEEFPYLPTPHQGYKHEHDHG